MKTVSIIGFGRFGKTLYRLLKDDFSITIYQRKPLSGKEKKLLNNVTKATTKIQEVYTSEVIFFAVPISSFESIIKAHKKYFKKNHLLIEVLSVKVHPKKVLETYGEKSSARFLLTHPMFGPDSSEKGFEGLPIVLCGGTLSAKDYDFWKSYFKKKRLRIVEMTAHEHDRLAARSQGLTHFIGRLLAQMQIKKGPIDSLGTKKLLEIEEQTCNDTWQLFTDLQQYNPYTKSMRLQLGAAYDKLYNKLLPARVSNHSITYGIQGGKGSFNEQALQEYLVKHANKSYSITYLYTSEKVLRNLHDGTIDYGLFATHNATGGIVSESIHAMARYKFTIVEEFAILIRHFLMKKRSITTSNITTIMAHSQNFKQCASTLQKKYPHLKLQTGEGDLVDTAKAAQSLSMGQLPESIAILGPRILSEIYGLDIIEEDLQDQKNNVTSFLLVSR